jgi:hypothetical protein
MGARSVVLTVVPAATKVAAKVGWAGARSLVRVACGRRRALRHFRRGLAEAGLPPEAIRELEGAYPGITIGRALKLGREFRH